MLIDLAKENKIEVVADDNSFRLCREGAAVRLHSTDPRLSGLIAVDVETGGLNPEEHSLLQVGLYHGHTGISDEFFVKGPGKTTKEALAVNGLDLEEIQARGVSPEAACNRISAYVARVILELRGDYKDVHSRLRLCGHNVSFDLAFLLKLYRHVGKEAPSPLRYSRLFCTQTLLYSEYAKRSLPLEATSLTAASDLLRVPYAPNLRHTSLEDAKLAYNVASKLL